MSDFRSGQPVRLFDEDNIPYSFSNPLPISIEESEGDEIHDFDEAVDVLKRVGASVTSEDHIYTVSAGKTLFLEKFLASGSGRIKAELQVETGVATDTYDSKIVLFSSTASPSQEADLKRSIAVGAGVRVKVVKSNLDNDDQSIYSTIIGVEK